MVVTYWSKFSVNSLVASRGSTVTSTSFRSSHGSSASLTDCTEDKPISRGSGSVSSDRMSMPGKSARRPLTKTLGERRRGEWGGVVGVCWRMKACTHTHTDVFLPPLCL